MSVILFMCIVALVMFFGYEVGRRNKCNLCWAESESHSFQQETQSCHGCDSSEDSKFPAGSRNALDMTPGQVVRQGHVYVEMLNCVELNAILDAVPKKAYTTYNPPARGDGGPWATMQGSRHPWLLVQPGHPPLVLPAGFFRIFPQKEFDEDKRAFV